MYSALFCFVRTMLNMSSKIAVSIVLSFCIALAPFGVKAHDFDSLGYGGPFEVRVDSGFMSIDTCTPDGDPECDGAVFANGEVDIHLPQGRTIVALGYEDEPMAMLDEEGNMFGNILSPSWWLNSDENMGKPPTNANAKAEPEWVWQRSGGALSYHEHRVHFMAAAVDPAISNGGDVSTFELKFIVDGSPEVVKGALVFVPEKDPDQARCLVQAGLGTPCSEPFSLPVWALPVAGFLLFVIFTAATFLWLRKSVQGKGTE